jgi:hypothetical protein
MLKPRKEFRLASSSCEEIKFTQEKSKEAIMK